MACDSEVSHEDAREASELSGPDLLITQTQTLRDQSLPGQATRQPSTLHPLSHGYFICTAVKPALPQGPQPGQPGHRRDTGQGDLGE